MIAWPRGIDRMLSRRVGCLASWHRQDAVEEGWLIGPGAVGGNEGFGTAYWRGVNELFLGRLIGVASALKGLFVCLFGLVAIGGDEGSVGCLALCPLAAMRCCMMAACSAELAVTWLRNSVAVSWLRKVVAVCWP